MWITAGFWHNLILPGIDKNIHAHHEGLVTGLVAYIILALIMSYIYPLGYKGKTPLWEGLKFGIIIGILWVFPHGLAMAGVHETSIIYEIKNMLYHIFEQGIGGIIIGFIYGRD